MSKTKIRTVDIVYWIALIGADIFVFIILGLLLIGYAGSDDSSTGENWSLASMNLKEKLVYICCSSWIILNIIGLAYIGRIIYRRYKYSK